MGCSRFLGRRCPNLTMRFVILYPAGSRTVLQKSTGEIPLMKILLQMPSFAKSWSLVKILSSTKIVAQTDVVELGLQRDIQIEARQKSFTNRGNMQTSFRRRIGLDTSSWWSIWSSSPIKCCKCFLQNGQHIHLIPYPPSQHQQAPGILERRSPDHSRNDTGRCCCDGRWEDARHEERQYEWRRTSGVLGILFPDHQTWFALE